jgi:preprotein translocase SecE subunit
MAISTFLKQTKAELVHVTWLSRKQVITYTIVVAIISLVVAYMLGGFDFVLELGLTKLLVK